MACGKRSVVFHAMRTSESSHAIEGSNHFFCATGVDAKLLYSSESTYRNHISIVHQLLLVGRAFERRKMCWCEICFGPPYEL